MAQARLDLREARLRVADRSEVAEAIDPEGLPRLERDNRLRCPSVSGPVGLVLIADLIEVDGDAGLPLAAVFLIREAGDIWHEVWVEHGVRGRKDRLHPEGAGVLLQLAQRADQPELQGQRVAHLRPEVLGEPGVEEDLIVLEARPLQRADHRVGRALLPQGESVHKVGQHPLGLGQGGLCGIGHPRLQKDTVGTKLGRGALRHAP